MSNYVLALKWSFSFLIALLFYSFFPNTPEAPQSSLYVGLTIWGVAALAMEIMAPEMIILALCSLYILFHIGRPEEIMRPWTTSTVWIIFAGVVIGHMIRVTGLARRIALSACTRLGGSYGSVLFGLALGGIILGPVITSALGKCVIICAVAVGCCQALKLKPMSKEATGLLFGGYLGVDMGRLGTLTGGGDNLMLLENYSLSTGLIKPTWVEFFLHNFPPALCYGISALLVCYFVCRPKEKVNINLIQKEYAELPAPSAKEFKGIILLVVLMLVFVFEKQHGMNIAFLSLLLAAVMFTPYVNLLGKGDLKDINLWMVVFIAASMSIGAAATAAGVDRLIAQLLSPYLTGSNLDLSYTFYFSGLVLNFFLTPLSAISALSVPFSQLALSLGLSPLPLLYSFQHGLSQLLFPYEVALFLYFYVTGYMNLKIVMTCFALQMLFVTLLFGFFTVPYWESLGLFYTL